jgi:UDP-glucose:(heptosyl)LPS alpha-1,3-glucosyltransferase
MQVGFIRRKYDSSGGAELSLNLLVREFLAQKRRVHVVAEYWQGEAPAGMELHTVRIKPGFSAPRRFARRALSTVEKLPLDACLSLERVPGVSFFRAGDGCHRAWLERRRRYEGWWKRFSFNFHPRHRVQLALEQEMFASSRLQTVIAGSHMVADEITRYYGLDARKIEVIYNPVDQGRVAPPAPEKVEQARRGLGLAPGRRILLFLGSGFERKGLAFMINALPLMPEATLLVAGQGRIGAYARLAAKMKVRDRICFLGLRGDVAMLLAMSQVLVLPTIYDPCANVCLEALAAGKPVVTTFANGAHELLVPGQNGFVVEDPSLSRDLADACLAALELKRPVSAHLNSMPEWLRRISQILTPRLPA